MVARPSLKRVVPGSVPPWRALCAESARALKAFFSVLSVSKSVLLLESKFGQILRALNLRAFWVRPSCPRVGRGRGGAPPQLLWPSGPRVVPGLFPPASACFSWPHRFGLPQRFSWRRAVVFHFRQSRRRGSLSSSLRLIRSLSTFAVETLLALRGAELPSWRGVAAKRELEIIAKPLGLLHEALLGGRSFLRTETRSCSLPLQRIACRLAICLVRCSPIFAVRHLLRRSRCVLSCAGVEADSW